MLLLLVYLSCGPSVCVAAAPLATGGSVQDCEHRRQYRRPFISGLNQHPAATATAAAASAAGVESHSTDERTALHTRNDFKGQAVYSRIQQPKNPPSNNRALDSRRRRAQAASVASAAAVAAAASTTTVAKGAAEPSKPRDALAKEMLAFLKFHGFPSTSSFPLDSSVALREGSPFRQAFVTFKPTEVFRAVDTDANRQISFEEMLSQFRQRSEFEQKLVDAYSFFFPHDLRSESGARLGLQGHPTLSLEGALDRIATARSMFRGCSPRSNETAFAKTQASVDQSGFFLCPVNWKVSLRRGLHVELPVLLFDLYASAKVSDARLLLLGILGVGKDFPSDRKPTSGVQVFDHRRNSNRHAPAPGPNPPMLWHVLQHYPYDTRLIAALLNAYPAPYRPSSEGPEMHRQNALVRRSCA